MDTQMLETFVAVCKYKNFSRAADELFVTQSTVTKRIAELEKGLNRKLFLRDKKHVDITAEGAIFLSYAERILELEQASVEEISARDRFEHFLRIGATNSIYECHLLPLISSFISALKKNAVRILIGHSADLLPMLQDGVLDIVFSYTPFKKAGITCIPFRSDKLVLVTDISNDKYQNGITKSELAEINYFMCNFALQEVGAYIRVLFPKHHQFSFEIDNSTKLIPYLLEGTGYSFLPLKMIDSHLEKKELRMIPLAGFETPVIRSYCVYRAPLENLVQELLNEC